MLTFPQTASRPHRLTVIQAHPVVAFFVLAYVISWAFEIPLVAVKQGWIQLQIPFAIHYLAAFGPMLSALIVTTIVEGSSGMRDLFSGLFKWRIGWRWILFSVLAPLALFALAAVAMVVAGAKWPNLSLLGEVDYLPYLGIGGAIVLWLLTYGMGEELGWRGFALPRLQKNNSALGATLILAVCWAFWHLPAFFYQDTYMVMGLVAGLPMFLLSIIGAAIVFTWLYNSSCGSLLPVILFHALFDLLSVSKAGGGSTAAIMSAVPMIWAVIVVMLFKPPNLSHEDRQVR
jgi:membrane protease YdiL (CAAX protease family)